MKDFLHHLFIPRQSNNHRSKLLHNKSIFVIIISLFLLQIVIVPVKNNFPQILGTTTNISSQELLLLTNKARQENGLSPLVMNEALSRAAQLKGTDMLKKNYWAHYAPDGTTPWFFFNQVGYQYAYAGENLARGFTATDDIVKAWMTSPAHRENVLSPKYRDVGFAVIEGNLGGEKTLLVVELFGATDNKQIAGNPVLGQYTAGEYTSVAVQSDSSVMHASPLINTRTFAWNIAFGIIVLFIIILIADMSIVLRKKIVRVVGHNIDHIAFLSIIGVLIVIFWKGSIL